MLKDAGFQNIKVQPKEESRTFINDWSPGTGLENFVLSAIIEAVKP
jgi:arsenite methyltransferase